MLEELAGVGVFAADDDTGVELEGVLEETKATDAAGVEPTCLLEEGETGVGEVTGVELGFALDVTEAGNTNNGVELGDEEEMGVDNDTGVDVGCREEGETGTDDNTGVELGYLGDETGTDEDTGVALRRPLEEGETGAEDDTGVELGRTLEADEMGTDDDNGVELARLLEEGETGTDVDAGVELGRLAAADETGTDALGELLEALLEDLRPTDDTEREEALADRDTEGTGAIAELDVFGVGCGERESPELGGARAVELGALELGLLDNPGLEVFGNLDEPENEIFGKLAIFSGDVLVGPGNDTLEMGSPNMSVIPGDEVPEAPNNPING